MHYSRSSRKMRNRGSGGKGKNARPYHQRCAVRVTYLKNKIRGQWKAHGRYVARESATLENDATAVGFDETREGIDIARELESWQRAGDEQMWKLIISPEFGDRVALSRLTRNLIEHMEKDLGTDLEWVAVEHHNTEHPHVHLVVRGIRNQSLRLTRDYVQHGIRSIAEDLCTRQIGYRTERDAAEAERLEIAEKRFTSIDRRFLRDAEEISSDLGLQYFVVTRNPVQTGSAETARLAVLRRMGLAELMGHNTWHVRRDFEQILRAMQRTADRQRTLAAHGALISDERLPIEVLDFRQAASVEGRVLVHGQDEQTGRNYLMLEATEAKVYFINYTKEMEQARGHSKLRTNSFVRLRNLDVNDLGDAERLLNNPRHLAEAARRLLKSGIMPTEDGWGGWLGKYQAALCKTTREIMERKERGPNRSLGR